MDEERKEGKASPPAEKQIRGDERFRTILDLASDVIVHIDTHGRVVDVNRRVEHVLGYAPEEMEGKDFTQLDFIPHGDAPRILKSFWDSVKKDKVEDASGKALNVLQLELKHKNGSTVSVEISTTEVTSEGELMGFVSVIRDISAPRGVGRKWRESEERYRELFEHTSSGVAVYQAKDGGRDFVFKDFNRAGERIERVRREDLIGKSISQVFPNLEEFTLLETLRKVWRTGEPAERIRTAVCKDGKAVGWRENRIYRLPDGDIVSIFDDVTEHHQAMQALRDLERSYEDLFNNSPMGIYRTTPDGRILMANPALVRMLGYSSLEELAARNLEEEGFEPSYPRSRFKNTVESKGEVKGLEAVWIRKDGHIIFVRENAKAVRDREGTVLHYEGTVENITEHKRTEEALRESEERFSKSFHASSNLMGISTAKEGRIIDINEAYCRLTGYKREELIGHTTAEFNIWADPGQRKVIVRKLQEEGRIRDLEVGIRSKSGDVRTVLFSADTITLNDEPCLINMAIDITERQQAEEALRTSRDMALIAEEVANMGSWEWDLESGKVTWSENCCRIHGIQPHDFDGRLQTAIGFIHADERESVQRQIEGMITEKSPRHFEYRIVIPGGVEKVIHGTNRMYVDGKGKLIRLVGMVQDITQRKRAEEALKASEARHKELADSITDVFFAMDKNLKYVFWNRASEKLTGIAAQNALGKSLREVFPDTPQTRKTEKVYLDVLTSKQPQTFVNEYQLGGDTLFFEISVYPSRDGISVFTKDITERKRAEEALMESEEKFAKAFHASPNLMTITTLDEGQIIEINEAYCRTMGREREECVGHTTAELKVWADPEQRHNIVQKVTKEGRVHNVEAGLQTESGQIRVLVFSMETITLKGEKYLLSVATDITERKRAELALSESEERFRRALENIPDVVVIYDPDLRIRYINAATRRLTGRPTSDFVGKREEEIWPPEVYQVYLPTLWEAFNTRAIRSLETDLSLPGGGVRNVKFTCVPLVDEESKVREVLGITHDFTEHRQAQEALQESERKYRDLVENINDVIYAADEMGNLTYMSPVVEAFTGYTPEEVIGRNYLEFVHPEDKTAVVEGFEEIKIGKLSPSEYRVITKDNREVWIRTFSRPVFEEGRFVGLRGVMTDITERKRLFQQLIQSEKSAAVGTLAYGIAHEFNNILAGIMANAEYGLSTDDVKQVRECFKIIVENSQRGSSITNSLLAVAGEKKRKRELADIRQPLENVLSFSRRELEKVGVRVVQDLKALPEIFCDPGEFSEVFLNMINNARDAMTPGGGTLTVKIDHARDHIRIVFEDTGCGIPEEIKDRIFDPFVTTKGALGKSEVPGTGLGLFVSRGIVDSYGGRIDVRSHPGKGTRFTITIPVTSNLPPESISREEIVSPKEIDTKLNILLIDDEETICKVLKKFLESKGHQVTASPEAKEGLKHFKKGRFDVVLSDITMPGMDGIELIRRIKEEDAHARIIAITGHVRQETLDRARKAGAQEILIKPFRSGELYDTILRLYQEAGQEGKTKGPAE